MRQDNGRSLMIKKAVHLETSLTQRAGLIEPIGLDALQGRVEDEFVVEVFDIIPSHGCVGGEFDLQHLLSTLASHTLHLVVVLEGVLLEGVL